MFDVPLKMDSVTTFEEFDQSLIPVAADPGLVTKYEVTEVGACSQILLAVLQGATEELVAPCGKSTNPAVVPPRVSELEFRTELVGDAPVLATVTLPPELEDPATVSVPCVLFWTPRVGVAVQDAADVLVAFGTVPAAALVAFVPPLAMVMGFQPDGS